MAKNHFFPRTGKEHKPRCCSALVWLQTQVLTISLKTWASVFCAFFFTDTVYSAFESFHKREMSLLQWFPVPSEDRIQLVTWLINKAFRGLVLNVTTPWLRLHTPGKMNHQALSVPPNELCLFSGLTCGVAVPPPLGWLGLLVKSKLPPGHWDVSAATLPLHPGLGNPTPCPCALDSPLL